MASGHACLNLSNRVDWHGFPAYAEAIAGCLDAVVVEAADSADLRIRNLEVAGVHVRLVYDDFPSSVSLESTSTEGDAFLGELFGRFSGTST
ncbi:MAG: DUF3630 family protein [bacterium]|nr:DUF3630 family protein [bacterium]